MMTICAYIVEMSNKRENLEGLLCHTTTYLFDWGQKKKLGPSRPPKQLPCVNAPLWSRPQGQRAWKFQDP